MLSKPLVLYFSVYGSTEQLAKTIARKTGADILEIVPAVPYESERTHYHTLAARAKREQSENARPVIANLAQICIEEYDTVYIGYPMWWYTFPMILYTLFESLDFSDKTLIPFNTHMGSGDGGTYGTLKTLAPGARILPGLPVEMRIAEQGAEQEVADWLESGKQIAV